MPHWLIKSAIQRCIAALPARQRWNEFFQEYGTKSLELTPERFRYRLDHCRKHLENFFSAQRTPAETFTALELGTGWYPVPTMGFYLCGATDVWTVDIDPLISPKRLRTMLERFCDLDDRGELKQHLPRLRPERMAELRKHKGEVMNEPVAQFLKRFRIHFMVRDAQETGLQPGTVDLLTSTGVLEYIPRPVLQNIFTEFHRICTPRGVMSHWINLVDQFSYFDRNITPFNYLKYTEKQWSRYNSPLIWQSRLRISDYRDLVERAGYEMLKEECTSGKPEDLARVQLSPEFANYRAEDLLVLTAWIVARPKKSKP